MEEEEIEKCEKCGHSKKKWHKIKGRKKRGDKILLFHGHAIAFEDIARMCIFFMSNEDILYPPHKGFDGGKRFQKYIAETLIFKKVPDGKEYQIRKNHGITKAPD